MARPLSFFRLRNLLLCSTLIAYSTTAACAVGAPLQIENANVVLIALKIQNLVDKFEKYKKKGDFKKLVEIFFELKMEAEISLGRPISIEKEIDKLQKDLKSQGYAIPKDQMKEIRHFFKKKEKKQKIRAEVMAYSLENDCPFDDYLVEILYEAKNGEYDKDKIASLTLDMQIGIICCLVGGIIYILPVPGAKAVGGSLVIYGGGEIIRELKNAAMAGQQ